MYFFALFLRNTQPGRQDVQRKCTLGRRPDFEHCKYSAKQREFAGEITMSGRIPWTVLHYLVNKFLANQMRSGLTDDTISANGRPRQILRICELPGLDNALRCCQILSLYRFTKHDTYFWFPTFKIALLILGARECAYARNRTEISRILTSHDTHNEFAEKNRETKTVNITLTFTVNFFFQKRDTGIESRKLSNVTPLNSLRSERRRGAASRTGLKHPHPRAI